MPPQEKPKSPTPAVAAPPKTVVSPSLNPRHADAIASLTEKGRSLYAEMVANGAKVAELQERNASIRQELIKIEAEIRNNAWAMSPLPAL